MEIKTKTLAALAAAGMTLVPAYTMAQSCCASGGHGVPAASGLGESAPKATNLATDPAWRIYEFQRDGVSYLQINDATGLIRAAVGRIGNTLWVLPMGTDVARVSLSITTIASPGRVVYETPNFIVWLRPEGNGDAWTVTSKN